MLAAVAVACSDPLPLPTHLVFILQPSSAAAGQTLGTVTVAVMTDHGDVATSSAALVQLQLVGGSGATLGGTTSVNAVAGIATFTNLSVDKVFSGYSLSANADGLTHATSASFDVTAGPATQLQFTAHPANGAGGQPLDVITVTARDAGGNVASSFANSVTLAFGANTGAATLLGTLTVNAINGLATFSNVRVDRPGVAYTLTATGSGVTSATSNPFDVTLTFASISAGGSDHPTLSSGHTCGVTTGGVGYCWGANSFGQLGDGSVTDQSRPTLVRGGLFWSQISAGGHHTCGLTTTNLVYCWGRNSNGQLGDLSTTQRIEPAFVMSTFSTTPQMISAGDMHTCFGTGTAALCWGLNSSGQLGDGTTVDKHVPGQVQGGRAFLQISADSSHTCAVENGQGGATYCWGSNDGGKLGTVSSANSPVPVAVANSSQMIRVVAGAAHSCGVASSAVSCWGRGTSGQIGDGTTNDQATPKPVSPPQSFVSVSAGSHHNCGLATSLVAYCWGLNGNGQVGDATTANRSSPTAIGGTLRFVSIDLGRSHSCGLTTLGAAYCWGLNSAGQLGDGTTTTRTTPTRIIQ